jgi:hypothetical protein
VSFQRASWYETNDLANRAGKKIVDQAESLRMKSAAVPLSDPKMLLLGVGRPVVRGNGMQVGAAKCKHSSVNPVRRVSISCSFLFVCATDLAARLLMILGAGMNETSLGR